MDRPTTTSVSLADRQRNLHLTFLQRNAFGIWVLAGSIVNWSILFSISCEALGATSRQIVAFGLFFIPFCMTILAGSVAHWHGRWARYFLGQKTRIVASCIVLDSWAACCALVYFHAEGPVWTAAWWYVFLPAIIWAVNRVVVKVLYGAM